MITLIVSEMRRSLLWKRRHFGNIIPTSDLAVWGCVDSTLHITHFITHATLQL